MPVPTNRPHLLFFSLLAFVVPIVHAEQALIVLDGEFNDWSGVPPVYKDAGDNGDHDLLRLWLADDDDYLFLRFEVNREIFVQDYNEITLYLDTDLNAETGYSPWEGMGAELVWTFGLRRGSQYVNQGISTILARDIGLRGGPTHTGTMYEFGIARDATPGFGDNPLFTQNDIRLALVWPDGDTDDRIPNAGEHLQYTMSKGELPPDTPIALARSNPADIRVVSYNVLGSGIFFNPDAYRRQLQAVEPDIICLQEAAGPRDVLAGYLNEWLPLGNGQAWQIAAYFDVPVISRFPVVSTWQVGEDQFVLLDTTDAWGHPLLLLNAHLRCCGSDVARQREIDEHMAFIRDAQSVASGPIIAAGSPVMLVGDMNFVGFVAQVLTATTGNIVNEDLFGPDFAPDWDGTPFANVVPRLTERRLGYTWRNDNSDFWPGKLDYHIYSDSLLALQNSYVLQTLDMPPAKLADYGLLADDSLISDHLLFVADYRYEPAMQAGDANGDDTFGVDDLYLIQHCLNGPEDDPLPSGPVTPNECRYHYDRDGDADVDLKDVATATTALHGGG